MKGKVITAREGEEVDFQIQYLKAQLATSSTTKVLTEAIHQLYKSFKDKEAQKSPFEMLEELNLIGCIEGNKNLSREYKKELYQSLSKKHGMSKAKKKS